MLTSYGPEAALALVGNPEELAELVTVALRSLSAASGMLRRPRVRSDVQEVAGAMVQIFDTLSQYVSDNYGQKFEKPVTYTGVIVVLNNGPLFGLAGPGQVNPLRFPIMFELILPDLPDIEIRFISTVTSAGVSATNQIVKNKRYALLPFLLAFAAYFDPFKWGLSKAFCRGLNQQFAPQIQSLLALAEKIDRNRQFWEFMIHFRTICTIISDLHEPFDEVFMEAVHTNKQIPPPKDWGAVQYDGTPEQYVAEWQPVYTLAATAYFMVTGKTLVPSSNAQLGPLDNLARLEG